MPLIAQGRAAVLFLAVAACAPLLPEAKSGRPGGTSVAAEQKPAEAGEPGGLPAAQDLALERHAMEQTLENTPSGESGRWSNPESGHAGSITPLLTYRTTAGQFCREFRESITAAAETREIRRTACRMLDGSWKIVRDE